ncbi:ankyrin repeat domain-containing protein [Candidatus Babeliales bacterium]|nr:ankyrin repeat domain-containing protein [Candidatus Babeliales bacterium]
MHKQFFIFSLICFSLNGAEVAAPKKMEERFFQFLCDRRDGAVAEYLEEFPKHEIDFSYKDFLPKKDSCYFDAPSQKKHSLLGAAVHYNAYEAGKALLGRYPVSDEMLKDIYFLLKRSIKKQHVNFICLFLEQPYSHRLHPLYPDKSLLVNALENKSGPAITKLLLSYGIDSNKKSETCCSYTEQYNSNELTPLMAAIIYKDPLSAKILVEAGADPRLFITTTRNAAGHHVYPLLMAARDKECVETVRLLLKHGADPRIGALRPLEHGKKIREGDIQNEHEKKVFKETNMLLTKSTSSGACKEAREIITEAIKEITEKESK